MAISLFGSASRFAQFYCLPAFAMSQGKSEEDGMSIIYTMSAFSVLGVVVGGFLADRSGYIAGIGLSQLAMGLFTLVLWTPSTTALAPMFVYAIFSGISSGILAAVFPPSIAQMFGISRLATTAGLVLAACMPAILATTPAATEFLTLAAGNRSTAWLIALSGVFSLVAGFIGLFLPLLQRRHVAQSVRKQTSGAWMQ
ncbi:hypothetical protein GQ54DRAFT_298951 [Martensiomyces pterosporus]|nr:hypothetical protein GQ54DRAFT_298951 [Martensiomyces pterosporus]